jgi:sugar phosphate isomerase/epimerase
MNFSRRNMLKLGIGAAGLLAAGVKPLRAEVKIAKKIPIGLQLYSVRDACGKDLPGVLAAVAKMGYQGVEFAGYYGRKAEALRKLLDDNGLKCCGTHTGLDTLTGNALQGTIEFNKTIGNKYLIVPGLPHANMASVQALIGTAKLLTELAEKVNTLDNAPSGMCVGYHAHGGDFQPVGGQVPWEVLFSHAGPGVVMQLDTGNCLDGGGNPIAILKKFPGRSATIHLKEHGGKPGAVIGEGLVKWQEVFDLCETTGGTQWYIVEQESYAGSPLDAVKGCLESLRKMGK